MRHPTLLVLGAALLAPAHGAALQSAATDSLEARVWLDRGDEPVVQRGDEVRVYYRTDADAYVAIFRIDTDGVIEMLFPQHPSMETLVQGGRDYRLLFPRSARWRVEEDPGAGYFFIVASPEPLDFSAFDFDDEEGWDLSAVGSTVYEDPYVAIDDYVAAIVPDWEVVPYALDFLAYSVGSTHEYPRFLCYDCHEYRSYPRWNPYLARCSTYRVVVWDDPYFYPRYRYVGTRVVFARPLGPRPRYGVVARVGGGWAPLVRTRAAPPRRTVEYKESPRAPSYQPRNPRPSRVTPAPAGRVRPDARPSRVVPPEARRSQPVALPGGVRSPTATGAPARTPPRAAAGSPTRGSGATAPSRPTLQRRPEPPSARLPRRAPSSATSRGAPARGPDATRRPPPGPSSRGAASAPRPPRARALPNRPPPRANPRGSAPGGRPGAARPAPARPPRTAPSRPPSAGSRAPTRRPSAGPSSGRPPPRARATPRRRPGGRGG